MGQEASREGWLALRHILRYVTTWVGGGSPRFWFSFSPQARQLNYAQVLVQLTDKEITPDFVNQVQPVSDRAVPGVRCDFRQLQTNPSRTIRWRFAWPARPTSAPPRSADDIAELRKIAAQVQDILRSAAEAARVPQ